MSLHCQNTSLGGHHHHLGWAFWLHFALTCLMFFEMDAVHADSTQVNEDESATAGIEYFEKHVRPILVDHCYECHSQDERSGGLLLDSRDSSRQGGDSGPAIIAGDPDQSLLIEAVRYVNRDLQMPPDNQLASGQIEILEKWISMGAPDPREGTGIAPIVSGMGIDDGRRFWSFQPIADPMIPNVKNSRWVKSPVDAFVLSQLERRGIEPAPDTDRRTLIRRMTYDLLGLPPTEQEVNSFITDDSPDAIPRLLERLLASPQYGVRWGRHWLDVARYADSNGLDENLAFGNAWRYRDYVVQSFNEDKPVDRFLVEQIAGDLIPDASEETRTATGFLVLGAKVLAEPDQDKLIMDTIDEQMDVIGKAFMGMTLGCVRCHDHKFDPIKQTDYYSLAAIFRSTKTFGDSKTGAIKHWNELVFASDNEIASIKEIDTEIAAKQAAAKKIENQAFENLRTEARERATEYLIAATQVDLEMPLTRVAEIARPNGLHPRILHNCRRHLHDHADEPFFRPWHEAQGDHHADRVERHYRPWIQKVRNALAANKDTKSAPLDDETLEIARLAIHDPSGFLAVPTKPEFAFDAATLDRYNTAMDDVRVFESRSPDVTAAMGVVDSSIVEALPIHIRGSHLNLGEPIRRAFPEVMQTSSVRTIFPIHQSGRLELARWMASSQHPLTARVYVNRLWRWHFGQGIVSSTENFGVLGERPSHPELLDWLARNFIQNGWSTKHMHRLIMGSRVYQMSSIHPHEQSLSNIDPESRLRWKFSMQRLDAEQLRDSILANANQLDQSLGGKTIPLRNRQFVFNHTSVDHTKYDSFRRAIYLPVIRNHLYSFFQQFDFPDPTMPTGNRNTTVVAPQALWMMNSELVMHAADQVASQILKESASVASRVEVAYAKILGRKPMASEVVRAESFIDQLTDEFPMDSDRSDTVPEHRAWSLFCQGLYASNEFVYLR